MDTTQSNQLNEAPFWATWVGTMAIIFGVFLTAVHGTEVLSHIVYKPGTAAVQGIPVDCESDELAEEGISLEECNLMGTTVKNVILSSPDWFRSFHIGLAAAGTIVAVFSVFIGIGLVDYRRWIIKPAIITFGLLLTIDVTAFLAIVNTGPLLRAMYLADILLWAVIHLMLTAAILAGYHMSEQG